MQKISKQQEAALKVAADIDKAANSFTTSQSDLVAAGIPDHIASDFIRRMDLMSDAIERSAGIDPQSKKADMDPTDIGEEKAGPEEADADESYMSQEFTQQENRELREEQESGNLHTPNDEPQKPTPGKQASYARIATLCESFNQARVAYGKSAAAPIQRLASPISDLGVKLATLQADHIARKVSDDKLASAIDIAGKVAKHITRIADEDTAGKLAKLITAALTTIEAGGQAEEKVASSFSLYA